MKNFIYKNQISIAGLVLLTSFLFTNFISINDLQFSFTGIKSITGNGDDFVQNYEVKTEIKKLGVKPQKGDLVENINKYEKDNLFNKINGLDNSDLQKRIGFVENKKYVSNSVPFFSQAPRGWNSITEETCENASLLNAVNYLGNLEFNETSYYDKLLELEDYKLSRYASNSITMEQLKEIGIKFFPGVRFEVKSIKDPIVEIKSELSQGNLVVFPSKGKELNNPYFTNGGPEYHVFLIRGYDDANFITNDVGTKRGDGYLYPFSVIQDAFRDFNGENNILVVSKR